LNYIKAIESHLYQFYEFVAFKGGLELVEKDHYSFVRNPGASWPNYVFRIDLNCLNREAFISALVEKMNDKSIPPFLITLEPENPEKFYRISEKYGLRMIYDWIGMAIEINDYRNFDHDNTGLKIHHVSSASLLKDWINIVNNALFNSKSLDTGLMKKIYQQEQMNLYLGMISKLPVATSLSFQKDDVAGLYMISTMPDYRGHGYGTVITRHTIEQRFKQEARCIILHSSRRAENIYKRIGFREYCRFGVLWLVGKEWRNG